MEELDRDELALSIVEGVLDRIIAWDTRTQSAAPGKRRPSGVCAVAVPVPPPQSARALSYNPCLVPNCSGAPHIAPTSARLLAERFDHAVETMDPAEIDHQYVHCSPQIVSHADIPLSDENYATAFQVRVAKQQTSCRCGHHAFHNALSAARAITAPTDVAAMQALADTQSEPAFWSRFNRSLASLHTEAGQRGTNCWPWDYDFIDGEVERSHMTHLLRTDFDVGLLGGDSTFLVFQYAMGRPMLETESLLACQAAADAFAANPGPCHRCIIVGALSHWITVVVNKVPVAGGASALEVLLFDSNNTPVLGVSDAQLAEIAAAKGEERGWGPASTKESYYRSSLHDMRSVVALLARLFGGATDLRAEAANTTVERTLADFEATVNTSPQGAACTVDDSIASEHNLDGEGCDAEAWHLWLRERQPPAVLRSGVLATVQRWGAFLSDLNRDSLRAWATRAISFSHRQCDSLDGDAAVQELAQDQAAARRRTINELAQVAEATLAAL